LENNFFKHYGQKEINHPDKLADCAIAHNRHFKFYVSHGLLEQIADNPLIKLNGDPGATPPVPADWPYKDPVNAAIRVEFQLPPARIMK
jgi:hypothetical protein